MYLTVRSPKGQLSTYDLVQWMAWSLELAQVNLKGSPDTVGIALVLRGPLNGMAMSVNLTVVDLGKTLQDVPEVPSVVSIGFPEKGLQANKSRLLEAFGVFTNGEQFKGDELTKLLEGGGKLAESYHAFVRCVFGGAVADNLQHPGIYGHYEHAGYRWVLSATRFPNLGPLEGIGAPPAAGGFVPPSLDPALSPPPAGGKGKGKQQAPSKRQGAEAIEPTPDAGAVPLGAPPADPAADGGLGAPPGSSAAEKVF